MTDSAFGIIMISVGACIFLWLWLGVVMPILWWLNDWSRRG